MKLFSESEKPEHLAIIGGGPIGIEMAQAHRRLGCDVTVIEAMRLLPRDDEALVDILRDKLIDEGIVICEESRCFSCLSKG